MNKDKLDAAIVMFEAMASDAIGIAISSEGNRQNGGDSVYLITDGETVYDGVLEQVVYTGMGA